MAFGQSRRRWFGACSCKPTPRGLPSSVKQLRTSSAFRLFAVLVAHSSRYPGQVNSKRPGRISNLRFRGITSTDPAVFYNPPRNMALTVGTQLGSHEITALLGKGGMGEVYRARDLKLKREVAIKILPEEFAL